MAKRFTDTTKWNDTWFRKLSIELKVFWFYVLDNCNEAGFWKIDIEAFNFFSGCNLTEKEILSAINNSKERIKKIGDKMFIIDFANFQYGSFRQSKHPFHKKLVKLIDSEYSIDRVSHTPQDKDKVKEEVKDKEDSLEEQIKPHKSKYSPSMVEDFINYWAEEDENGIQAWEKAKKKKGTWDIKRRLATWKKQGEKFERGNTNLTKKDPPPKPRTSSSGGFEPISKLIKK